MDSHLRSTNPILEACSPVFNLLRRIQEEPLPVNDRLVQQVLTALDQVKVRAQANHITSADITKIKFVMVVFCDEMILSPKRSGQSDGVGHSLQDTLLGIDNGSELFFHKLEKLLKTSKYNINLLELYYLCLELGFQGDKLDQLKQHRLRVQIGQEIARIRGRDEQSRLLHDQIDPDVITQLKKSFSFTSLLSISAVVITVIFILTEFFLREEVQQHHYYIKEQAQLLIDIVAEGVK